MSFKKGADGNRAAPPEVVEAVVKLALTCAAHKIVLEESDYLGIIAAQKAIMTKQRQIIARLEQRLGIDDDL